MIRELIKSEVLESIVQWPVNNITIIVRQYDIRHAP